MNIKSNFLNIANGEIHYFDLGADKEDLPPIVFLHGWGLDASVFLPSLQILSKNRRVIAPDLPGFGKSKCKVNNWDYETFANMIIELIDKLELKQIVLMGHSLGAGVSIKISLDNSNVKSMILVDSAGTPFESFWRLVLVRWWKFLDQLIVQSIFTPKYNFLLIKSFVYNVVFNFTTCIGALNMPLHCELESAARQAKVKTLIIWAEKDRTTPLEIGLALSEQMPNSQLIVIKGNYYHEWGIMYPEKLVEIANEFLGH